jgi:hypothetical protein
MKLRVEMEDPAITSCFTDTVCPARTIPAMDIPLPKRRTLRMLKLEPMAKKSNAEILLPHLVELRKEIEEPKFMKPRIDVWDPTLAYDRKDIDDPR